MRKGQMKIKAVKRGLKTRAIYALTAQGVWRFKVIPEDDQLMNKLLLALGTTGIINKQHWDCVR